MPNIFDNLAADMCLGPALQASLRHFDTVDVATGYLDLRGWREFADILSERRDEVGRRPMARVLVGMVAPADSEAILTSLQEEIQPPPYGSDVHDREKALRRRDQLVAHLRNQLMRGLATRESQATLRALKEQLEEGLVEMRVFTAKPLHGKTYIFHAPSQQFGSRWAYVGSSNLTNAGLNRNLELNIDVQDGDATGKLAAWFEDRWNDPFSLEISAEIIQLISESWADLVQPTPFEVYLKVCHSLSEDARDGLGYVLPASMRRLLLDYQETAVRTLSRRIVRRGGTMLGDVVGLGKTLTAIGTALMLQAAEDYSTLVLCPKNLVSMWSDHCEAYELEARVVPYSMVDRVLPELRRYNLVICDESHNLRNNGTIAYEAIQAYIRRNDAKVLLLTATPYNLDFADVASQLALYLSDDEDLGIVPATALAADPTLATRVDGKINTLAAFRRSGEPDDWRRLMSDHLVRRTRTFIKRTAKKEKAMRSGGRTEERPYLEFADGSRFHFPERIARPLSHDFGRNDPARLMEDDISLDAVRSLTLPRYRLADYDNPKAEHSDSDISVLADIKSGRGNVSGFVRTGLFKRLSSSGHSFIVSLQRQRARNELFVHAIDSGLPIPVGTFTDRQIQVTDEDLDGEAASEESLDARYRNLQASLPRRTKWINSGVFKPTLRTDLIEDNRTISMLLDRFGVWDAARDSKVAVLADLIRRGHPADKVLVFSEYADTAEYVAQALEATGIQRVAVATGNTADPADLARRFSPHSNALPGQDAEFENDESPIDVLVATDVLSEGQNLQDSHVVVNYDLPWAIIRIIQRAGRVDRVGQTSDTVYVYLISHERIEDQINLRRRIKERLGAAAQAFGSDEQFFGSDQEIKILEDFHSGHVADETEELDGEVDAVSEAWLVWSNAVEKHPEITTRVKAMQDMVQSTRDQYITERRGSVTAYVATESGVDAFACSWTSDSEVEDRLLTPLEAMKLFYAEVDTPTAPLRDDHLDRQAALVRGPLTIETLAAGNLRGIRKWVWERLGGTLLLTAEAGVALDALHDRPLTSHATSRLQQARRQRYSLEDLTDLVMQLHEQDRLVVGAADTDAIRLVCSIGVRER
jgi:superfamily II DNA or RNA helicase